jgi:hypothetical protein
VPAPKRHGAPRLVAVGLICAALGAGASAIAVAGASTPHTGAVHHRLRPRALLRRAVQAQLVVATRRGFVRVSLLRGTVRSIAGRRLTLLVGTRRASYRTVTVSLPARTRVRDNHERSTLSALRPGQRALIIRAPHRALVIAHAPRAG